MKKIAFWLAVFLLFLLVRIGGVFVALETNAGQKFLTACVNAYLQDKFKVETRVGRIRLDLPHWVSLEDVLLRDPKGDTLLSGRRLYLNMDMLSLLGGEVAIKKVELEGVRAKVYRIMPDKSFNYQYILDAFATTEIDTTTSEPMKMSFDSLVAKEIRLTYIDPVSGTNADISLPKADIVFDKFNPDSSRYHIKDLILDNANLDAVTYQALFEPQTESSAESDSLDLKLGNIRARNLRLNYADSTSALRAGLNAEDLRVQFENLFLEGQKIDIKEIALKGANTYTEFGKQAKPTTEETAAETNSEPGWRVNVSAIRIDSNSVRYDDFNEKPTPKGLDYSHLLLTNLTASLDSLKYSADGVLGNLKELTVKDRSGFSVQKFETLFGYTRNSTFLKNLLIKTPNTTLGGQLALGYQSRDVFSNDIGKTSINLNLIKSRLGFKDILMLAPELATTPPFDNEPNGQITGSGQIRGTVGNMKLYNLRFSGLDSTSLLAEGEIKGLPDTDALSMDVEIKQMATTKADLLRVLPDSLLPDSLELPEKMTIVGKIDGNANDLRADATLKTSSGDVMFSGNLKDIGDSSQAVYKGKMALNSVNLGKILKMDPKELGKISLKADFDGAGYDLKTMKAAINVRLDSADFNGYVYKNLDAKAQIANNQAELVAKVTDENIDLNVSGQAGLAGEYPTIKAEMDVKKLDLRALKLYADSLRITGKFKVDMTSTDPENPLGTISADSVAIEAKTPPVSLGDALVKLENLDGGKSLTLRSDPVKASVKGNFNYASLAKIFENEINKYFKVTDFDTTFSDPYDVRISGSVQWHPVIEVFAPELTQLAPVNLSARLTNEGDSTLTGRLSIPKVEYDSNTVSNARVNLMGIGDSLTVDAEVDEVQSGSFRVRRLSLGSILQNNSAALDLVVKDSLGASQHAFSGILRQNDGGYNFHLVKNLVLDYVSWLTDTSGFVNYSDKGLVIKNLFLEKEGFPDRIRINSTANSPNAPLEITTENVAVGPLVKIFMQDSTLASGELNGNLLVSNYMGDSLSFKGNAAVKNLAITEKPLGNLAVEVGNEGPDKMNIAASLKGENNDAELRGDYLTISENPFDLDLKLNNLSAKTIEAFSLGELKNADGALKGTVHIGGNTDNPLLDGQVNFDSVAFNVTRLGARYKLNNQKITFSGPKVSLNNFVMQDTLGLSLTADGSIELTNIPDVSYDLSFSTDKFLIMNSSRKDNDTYFGKGFAKADISLKGQGASTAINGTVRILKDSDIIFLMPDDAAAADAGEGVVEFVNSSGVPNKPVDSTQTAEEESFFASQMSLNIETDPEAKFMVVVDELNGDNLKIQGNAELNAGIAPNGQFFLLGVYELMQGSYDLTLEILKKQFLIRKGSQLIWSGDPTRADIDITAVYEVDADPSGLSPDNTQYGKVPFNVLLKISGNLESPQIAFEIEVAETANDQAKQEIERQGILEELKMNMAEMNKQVFSLLMLNKFMTNSSSVVTSGGFNAEAIARQSVSKFLTDQLNNLASDLIKGIQLDFNLNSTTADISGARTDLNVGLSKAFLNDRLTVSVGRNFELENQGESVNSEQILDNVAINYRISRDGGYMVRAYYKNQFQSVLEGYIIETGVSFIMTLDYDLFKEFFEKKVEP